MKLIKLVALFIFLLITLTGCWDNIDITDLALVTGVALDKTDDDKLEITVQIVKPSAIKPSGDGGGTSEKGYVNISGKGETFMEADRDLLSISDRKLYWGYNQLVVLSDSIMREDINQYLDAFERGNQVSQKSYVLVAKNMKAKTVLEYESHLEKIPTTENVSSLEAANMFSKSFKISLMDLFKILNQEGHEVVLPVLYMKDNIEVKSQENLFLEGSAFIKKGKLVEYMNPVQTRGYLYTQNKVKKAVLNIQSLQNKEKKTAIDIVRSKGKVKALIQRSKPVLSIEVDAEGNIAEQQEQIKISDSRQIDKLDSEMQNKIEQEIQEAVNISQKHESDIFGFGEELYKNYYPQWEQLAHNWNETYSKLPIDINVRFNIRRSGLINEGFKDK